MNEDKIHGSVVQEIQAGRRNFIQTICGTAAGLAAFSTFGGSLLSPRPAGANGSTGSPGTGPGISGRPEQAYQARIQAAQQERDRPVPDHPVNGDESLYANKIGNFSKGLPHDSRGEVDPNAYTSLLTALASGQEADFAAIPLGGTSLMSDPRSAYAFLLEGADPSQLPFPAPPAFSSADEAAEAAELYWMALARDVPFSDYGANDIIGQAVDDLSGFDMFSSVTPTTLFRGSTDGDRAGPYLSQFLWLDVPCGAYSLPQVLTPPTPAKDYLVDFDTWLHVQNGIVVPALGQTYADQSRRIINGRDMTEFVHKDYLFQAFLNAGLILEILDAPLNGSNPYPTPTESGFGTGGYPFILNLLGVAAQAALITAWVYKWLVHRRVRPEEFGGRVHVHKSGLADYPIDDSLLGSAALQRTHDTYTTWLLPQAYYEGCPLHPSYPAGHAVVAGACATVLKAFFDETYVLPAPRTVSTDGSSLAAYDGPGLTVGGELNKLATNQAFARNFAGVHWRSDGTQGILLGEQVGISLLQDLKTTMVQFSEAGFSLTGYNGNKITI